MVERDGVMGESDSRVGKVAASKTSQSKLRNNPLVEMIKVLVSAGLIALGIRTILYEPFNIPSESMLPSLMVGDYIFVSKFAYGYSRHSIIFSPPLFEGRILNTAPERGDVVVFKLPRDGRTDYIKRLIGLPGDRIQLVGGQVYLNGKALPRERIDDFVTPVTPNTHCAPPFRQTHADGQAYCHYPRFRETLPSGRSYATLDLTRTGANDTTREFIVPPGHYFMMGDNRDNSQDSRLPPSVGVGYVPADNLVGRAEVIFYSTDGGARLYEVWNWFGAARYGRVFEGL